MGLFGTQKATKGTVEEVASMVESYFHGRDLDVHEHQLQAGSGLGWWLKQGSASIYIYLQETANGAVIRITSPLVNIPKDNREAFFRRLLDINSDLSGCALSTHGDVVLVVTQRQTLSLDQSELDELVWNVAYVADLLDDQFATEFGASLYRHSQT